MTPVGTLVVGAGQAGIQIAVSLRELGDREPIHVAGAESTPPYQRPPLSKGYLLGDLHEDSLHLRTAQFYRDREITLLLGTTVSALRPAPDCGWTAVLGNGRELAYARLALATGARPRKLSVPGAELAGVHTLRTLADADAIRAGLAAAQQVVVIGGGFIGLEAAAVARSLGKEVTVVEAADRLLGRSLSAEVADFLYRAHCARGVAIHLGAAAAELRGEAGRVTDVVLGDGTVLPADLVVVGVGAESRTELAEAIGLACRGGIVVDQAARTSHPGVVAAGDCTVGGHHLAGPAGRFESVQNATDQAKVAAATLLGAPARYDEVPFFWSDQGDLKLQMAGWTGGADTRLVRGDPSTDHFAVLHFRDGRLAAVEAVNAPQDFLAARRAITKGQTIDPVAAADHTVALRTLLRD